MAILDQIGLMLGASAGAIVAGVSAGVAKARNARHGTSEIVVGALLWAVFGSILFLAIAFAATLGLGMLVSGAASAAK